MHEESPEKITPFQPLIYYTNTLIILKTTFTLVCFDLNTVMATLCTYQSICFSQDHKHTYLSSTSSSSLCRSQAMYSRAMSVIRGHQDKSRLRSLRRFSATSSTPSSVILEQPERLRAVRLGRLCTMLTTP